MFSNLTPLIYIRTTAFGDSVRIERVAEDIPFSKNYNAAFTHVSDFYAQSVKSQTDSQEGIKSETLFAEILRLPEVVMYDTFNIFAGDQRSK